MNFLFAGKLGEDMSAKVLGFVKCPICREMHYTEPVESGMQITVPDFDTSRDPNSDGIAGNEGGAGGSGGVQTGANQFVFRVNYALLSAIEHNLMHISAEELAHPHIGQYRPLGHLLKHRKNPCNFSTSFYQRNHSTK